MLDDDKFNEFLRRAATDYKSPHVPPSDTIWAHIESEVADAIRPTTIRSIGARRAWLPIGAAIAATLMLGVALGRSTSHTNRAAQVAAIVSPLTRSTIDDSARGAAYVRAVTFDHLADAEIFLTSVRADLRSGHADADRAQRSRELLSRTRLLLGAEAERNPAVARLLEDLELMLAEIAALPPGKPSMDTRLLDETMRQGNLLPRIRATLPAPAAGA